jgi:hypothetical protein
VIGSNCINVNPWPPRAPGHLVARQPTPGSVDLCFRWDGQIEEAVALLSKQEDQYSTSDLGESESTGELGRATKVSLDTQL